MKRYPTLHKVVSVSAQQRVTRIAVALVTRVHTEVPAGCLIMGTLDGGSLVIRGQDTLIVQGIVGDYAGTFLASIAPIIVSPADRGLIR